MVKLFPKMNHPQQGADITLVSTKESPLVSEQIFRAKGYVQPHSLQLAQLLCQHTTGQLFKPTLLTLGA